MNKILATTALSAAFLLALTGCSVGVEPAASEPSSATAPSAATDTAATPDTSSAGLSESTACTGGEPISLDQEHATMEFTGDCGDVSVTADAVTASFEQVGDISVTGSFATLEVAGSAGNISVAGSSNTVSTAAATGVEVAGSNNTVTWTSGVAAGVETGEGTGNTLSGPAQ